MALDFPSNPTNGQIYGNYYYDAATASWRSNPLVSGSAFISDNAPVVSPSGSIWYNSNDGTMFVRYGEQWVEARSNQKITPGSIVQVVQAYKRDVFSLSVANVWTDVPGLSVSITPKFSSSNILVSVNGYLNGAATIVTASARLVDGSGNVVGGSTAEGNRTSGIGSFPTSPVDGNSFFGMQFLDTPGTTSPKTYKLQILADGTSVIYINRSRADVNAAYVARGISSITLMEVAQ